VFNFLILVSNCENVKVFCSSLWWCDRTLPGLLDSDDELRDRHYQLSKMQWRHRHHHHHHDVTSSSSSSSSSWCDVIVIIIIIIMMWRHRHHHHHHDVTSSSSSSWCDVIIIIIIVIVMWSEVLSYSRWSPRPITALICPWWVTRRCDVVCTSQRLFFSLIFNVSLTRCNVAVYTFHML